MIGRYRRVSRRPVAAESDGGDAETAKEREPVRSVAIRLLAVRPLTRPELRERLSARDYSGDEIDGAIAFLEAGEWMPDDESVVRSWAAARVRQRGVGRQRLSREIAGRGLSTEAATRIASEVLDPDDEVALLERELERVLRSVKESALPREGSRWAGSGRHPAAARGAKVFARLLRRGFSPDGIRAAMGRAGFFDLSRSEGTDPDPDVPKPRKVWNR